MMELIIIIIINIIFKLSKKILVLVLFSLEAELSLLFERVKFHFSESLLWGWTQFFFLLLTFSRFSSSPLIREANKSIYYTVAGVQTWELRPTVTNNPANHLPRSSALLFAHICIPESKFHYSCFLLITDLNQGKNTFGYSFWFFPPKKYI